MIKGSKERVIDKLKMNTDDMFHQSILSISLPAPASTALPKPTQYRYSQSDDGLYNSKTALDCHELSCPDRAQSRVEQKS
jgi:hypothetical protein